jgi:hypothetical protein
MELLKTEQKESWYEKLIAMPVETILPVSLESAGGVRQAISVAISRKHPEMRFGTKIKKNAIGKKYLEVTRKPDMVIQMQAN